MQCSRQWQRCQLDTRLQHERRRQCCSSAGYSSKQSRGALLKSSTCRPVSVSLNVTGPDATVVVLPRQVPLPGAGAGAKAA